MSNVSFKLATPSSAYGNLCVQKTQYNTLSKLSEVYNKAKSIKERGGEPGVLGSSSRFCPCPGFQDWGLLPVVDFIWRTEETLEYIHIVFSGP